MNALVPISVLIESDWNLKDVAPNGYYRVTLVLIESDWNLKTNQIRYIYAHYLY